MKKLFAQCYDFIVFTKPLNALIILLLLLAGSAYFIKDFRMDASADSLVLENDQALKYYREVSARYASEDFLFIAYKPFDGDILSDQSLKEIGEIKKELLAQVPRLSGVFTVLDAPLIDSPRQSLTALQQNGMRTVLTPDVDKNLARKELEHGIAYGNNLVSNDGSVTNMLVTFERDEQYFKLLNARAALSAHKHESSDALFAYERAAEDFLQYQIMATAAQKQDIQTIRNILAAHRDVATIFLGGAGMIAVDMIDFISSDLMIFGVGILILLVGTLVVIFRQARWVLLPLLSCVLTVGATTSLLGLLEWPVTVISSNYISLLLIITLSMNIHLVVRYRLLHAQNADLPQRDLVIKTIREMALPCFYMTATTVVAFGSLVVSGIRPVIDFGWMMVCGVSLAYIISFLVFPMVLQLLKKQAPVSVHDSTENLTIAIGKLTLNYGNILLALFILLAAFTVYGISKLEVENRFIDYFKDDTEIHQGMLLIDQKLGGTTPLEVTIDPDKHFYQALQRQQQAQKESDQIEDSELDDIFGDDDLFADSQADKPINYWFNQDMLTRLGKVHDYLQNLPAMGKVMSAATANRMATLINNDTPLNDFELNVLDEKMPEVLRKTLIAPYLSPDYNQARIVMRVIDSYPNLRRDALIKQIHHDIVEKFGFEPEQVRMTGLLVLYNNMLQSLFSSQILTIGVVMGVIFLMFIVLFKSVYIAFVGMLPNILSATAILGLIGWLKIPLDFMTITIASITVGIAVDNAIHYIYNFQSALLQTRDYAKATLMAHASVGKAMYFTSITIIMGFSILAFSNFVPSLYFGVLSGIAMAIALLCNLLLLPRLLRLFKPFKMPAEQHRQPNVSAH